MPDPRSGTSYACADPFAPQGGADVRKAVLTINMTPRKERSGISKQDIEAQLRDALNKVRTSAIACEYSVPENDGTLDFGKVNVQYAVGANAPTVIGAF